MATSEIFQNKFKDKYSELNKSQKEAVDTIYGPVMVVAGPGTGKTTLLTLRIANILIETDTRPEQILALTFTESGVKAMKDKLREIIGSDALKVNIFTYHSFAEQILRRYNDYFAEFNNFRFINEDDSITLFEEIIDNGDFERIKSTFSPYFQIKNIINYIKELKREFIDPEKLGKLIDIYEDNIKNDPDNISTRGKTKGEIKSEAKPKFKMVEKMREIVEVYEIYESKKNKLRHYDFDDVINEVVKKVEKEKDLQFEIAEEYQFILADEHQDANESQNKILDMFNIIDKPNIMVVGDEKQAIFRFQGGTLENFTGFEKRYEGAKRINLEVNYRSHQNILDYSFDLISKRADLLINKNNLKAEGRDVGSGKIKFVSLYDKDSESEYIGMRVKEIIENSDTEDIAIIYRQNKEKDNIARALDLLNIRYTTHNDNELFSDRSAIEFVTTIKLLNDFYDNESIARILCSSVFNISIDKVHKINKDFALSSKSYFEVLSESEDEEIKGVVGKIKYLSDFALKNSPVLLVEEFARKTDYLKTSDGVVLNHKLGILRSFADMAKQVVTKDENANIKSFKNFLDKAIEYDMKVTIPKDVGESRVNLMTAHKSKGLEFDNVFIVNVTNSDWGESKHRSNFINIDTLLSQGKSESNLEDARKLLFVSMTRAKKHLELTFPKFKIDGRENEESGFIGEIRTDLIERVDIEKKASLKFTEEIIPKDKIDFYRDLFLSQSFSVSALNNFLQCSNKYLFNNLLRFPFAQNLSLFVGNVTHDALEEYWNLVLRKKEHTAEMFYVIFERLMNQQAIKDRERKSVLKEYKPELLDFVANNGLSDDELYKVEYKLEHEYPFEYNGQNYNIFIKGYVDRVDEKSGSYFVIDFKTGKPKSRNEVMGQTQNSDQNYLRQITFYKMFLELMDNKVHVNSGQINFVKRDDNAKRVAHTFELTSEMVTELKSEIENVFEEIMSGEFLLKGCDEKDCEYCELRKSINI